MLAGYLPFDDDPANPEGDNINLLYKYIVNTPLTFPEYVTPHARDLLRRILIPDPRRRADLFEVARHSWLSEYSHVVGFIGSTAKSDHDIASSALQQEGEPALGRSASVREPSSRSPAMATTPGGVQKQPAFSTDDDAEARSQQRDAKRRTVQLEYVAPKGATTRAEAAASTPASAGRTRARGDSQGPVEVAPAREPQVPRKEVPTSAAMPPPAARPTREQARAASDSTAFTGQPTTSQSRPNTGGTLGSGARLSSRGNSYSQPAAATPTNTNAQGHFSQPKSSTGYIISSPMSSEQGVGADSSRPDSQQNLSHYQNQQYEQQQAPQQQQQQARGHKRSTTLGSITDRVLGRSNSRRQSQQQQPQMQQQDPTSAASSEKRDRRYPPVSMKNALPNSNDDAQPRMSSESRRSSFNFLRKNSESNFLRKNSETGAAPSERRSSRRFSFLPSGLSMNSFSGKKDQPYDSVGSEAGAGMAGKDSRSGAEAGAGAGVARKDSRSGRPASKGTGFAFGGGKSRSPSQSTTNSTIPLYYEADREAARQRRGVPSAAAARYEKALPAAPGQGAGLQRKQFRDDGYGGNLLEPSTSGPQQQGQQEPVERYYTPTESAEASRPSRQQQQQQPDGYNAGSSSNGPQQHDFADDGYNQTAPLDNGRGAQNIRPQQRKFGDAYDQGHGGSSSGARRVMDFFRRRGKDRTQA